MYMWHDSFLCATQPLNTYDVKWSKSFSHVSRNRSSAVYASGHTRCSVLQYVVVCCSGSRSVAVSAVCCSVLQCVAVCCSVLQCAAVCCNVLQCAAACCSMLHCVVFGCSVLQFVAVCCSVLPHCAHFVAHSQLNTSHFSEIAKSYLMSERVMEKKKQSMSELLESADRTCSIQPLTSEQSLTAAKQIWSPPGIQILNAGPGNTTSQVHYSIYYTRWLQRVSLRCIATHCYTLQHTATHCNTLQHTATQWLQSVTIRCITHQNYRVNLWALVQNV